MLPSIMYIKNHEYLTIILQMCPRQDEPSLFIFKSLDSSEAASNQSEKTAYKKANQVHPLTISKQTTLH